MQQIENQCRNTTRIKNIRCTGARSKTLDIRMTKNNNKLNENPIKNRKDTTYKLHNRHKDTITPRQ
jgi:hypothetical protein